MDGKRMLTGTVAGGVVLFVLGFLAYDVLLGDFFAMNMGSATGVNRDPPVFWALAVGNLALAALVTRAILAQPMSVDAGGGFRLGAMIMFLVWVGVDFIQYAVTNVWNLTAVVVDPLVSLVLGGVMGAVIAMVAGKKPA